MTFEELNLAPAIVQAVHEQGYTTPTPIQEQAIPAVLAGHDLLAGAQTGTGKTAAFSLPILHRLTQGGTQKPAGGIRALILSPTRELAAQIEDNLRSYAQHLPVKSTVIFGGVGMKPQIDRIRKGIDILVATPGRLLDLQQQGLLDLSHVEVLVLDEADRMLDMGFIHDVKKILALVPKDKQSLLFSATFSDDIRELAGTLLKNPQSIQVTPRNTTVQRITQIIHPVGRRKKKEALLHIIQEHNWSQVLVFTRTKFGANHVAEYLTKHGVTAMALHGNKSQSARTQALAGFKTGELRALVATDIAARGIDIDELPHVVNYEIPNVPEDYVHRIGRTGRAGREGHAVSLVCLDEEGFMMEIERFTKQEIPVQVLPDFGPEEGEKAEPIAMGRQTIWGGAGKPPSREVMQAAAKAARQEMMERIRSTKTAQPNRGGGRGGRKPVAEAAAQASGEGHPDQGSATPGDTGPRRGGQGYNRSRQRPGRSSTRPGEGLAPMRESRPPRTSTSSSHNRPPRSEGPDYEGGASSRFEFQPPTDAHLGTQLGRPRKPARAGGSSGQPDPTRTSVDLMVDRPRRGGPGFSGGPGFAGNRRRSGGGGGNFGR
ncbi:MAG: DEAD/DEAH box helicase [Comamonas sp.]|jgi:ATP-dependent RNA helicase RhlE|nr:DEAD/DEAH box helicase [Comamonas sp.]MCZ2107247.1 DEAD/DEAH box helicase [Burkholderiales bacterium]HRL90117.1 DEAD/DEAH box helicase [Comamonas denitrificans]MBP6292941.1 DEAD/DEAH box helicase [Comamonas sp.]MBP7840710.1 DEAD/DEAH box helicase [Comamonas sp.]